MSGNDDKPHAAADRIKAATLSVAKGLSRAQAERAAAAAARNVNAYGQKEEGPSRWQERKEAKRQMYLMSTEKAAKLGTVKPKTSETSSVGAYTQCQKCFQHGHWTYECKNERVYISRPSRTQQLKNPKLKKSVPVSYQFENPDIIKEREEEQKLMKEKQKEKAERKKGNSKRKHRSPSDSDSNSSGASVFDSDSESSVTGSEYSSGSSSSYSSSDSEDKKRQHRRKQKKRRHRRDSTSSASSESESASDSDSDDKGSRRKSKRRSGRR
jgi:hypothetical protein